MPGSTRVGERIRMLREQQNLSVEELAERARMGVEPVRRLEAGEQVPSLTPLLVLARSLGVRLGSFLDDHVHDEPVITRAGEEAKAVRFAGANAGDNPSELAFKSLAANKSDRHMEPFVIDVQPPVGEHQLSSHEGEEFIYVLDGAIEVQYGAATHRLRAGDSIYYDSIVRHHLHAADGRPAKILAVVYAPY